MKATSASDSMLLYAMNAMQLGVVIMDQEGSITLWNSWMEIHSGITSEQALSRQLIDLFPELSGTRLPEAIAQACQKRLASVLSPALHRSPLPLFLNEQNKRIHRRFQQLIQIMPLSDDRHQNFALMQVTDMSATVNREQLLRQQAAELKRTNLIDQVTGIANRRSFDETLIEEFYRAQRASTPLALIMVDIDHFKLYNDRYGHAQGDQCLARVAVALQSGLKRAGDLAARYGGEEFGIVLPGMGEAGASDLARDLCLRIEALGISHESSPVAKHVTISVGVASFTPGINTHNFNALISSADVALYEAKNDGRNRAILFSIANGGFNACD